MYDEALNELIRLSLNTIMGDENFAIRAMQKDATRPLGLYADVNLVSDMNLGWGENNLVDRFDGDIDEHIREGREVMVSIGIYRQDTLSVGKKLSMGLTSTRIQDLFNSAKVGLLRRTEVRNITEALESGWEQRAQFDIFINVVGEYDDILIAIESATIKGTIDDIDLEINIGDPP